jgi:hypothetical protein
MVPTGAGSSTIVNQHSRETGVIGSGGRIDGSSMGRSFSSNVTMVMSTSRQFAKIEGSDRDDRRRHCKGSSLGRRRGIIACRLNMSYRRSSKYVEITKGKFNESEIHGKFFKR